MINVETFHNRVILHSCTYCIYDETSLEGYLIDAGDSLPVLTFIKDKRINIRGIFLTHCHFDHVYGINDFVDAISETKIYCSHETLMGLKDENLNMSYMYQDDEFIVPTGERYFVINHNSKVTCFGKDIEILSTSGHDVDCLCFIIGDSIFTGDSYIPYAPVIYPWKHSNKDDALKNEQMLKGLVANRGLNVYPGHFQ
jgi:glyoxylase-like metal-dependent hydrolase (beta-lactamase superfamily II)